MIRHLLWHHWKAFIRSPLWTPGKLLYNIFLVAVLFHIGLSLIAFGYFADVLLLEMLPQVHPLEILNEHLVFTFLILFAVGLYSQKTPILAIQRYLHLPAKKSRLVHFFLFFSLFNTQSFYPLAFFVPFWVKMVFPSYQPTGSFSWLIGILLFLVLSNCLIVLCRLLLYDNPSCFFGLATALSLFLFFDYTLSSSHP